MAIYVHGWRTQRHATCNSCLVYHKGMHVAQNQDTQAIVTLCDECLRSFEQQNTFNIPLEVR